MISLKNMKVIMVSFLWIVLLKSNLYAQLNTFNIDTVSNDAETSKSLTITDAVIININGKISSPGKQDITEPIRLKEKNSCWILLKTQDCGILTFTIIPNNPKTNIDFAVFNTKIDSLSLLRENLSVQKINDNQTGLNLISQIRKSDKASNNNFSKSLPLKQNQEVLLYLNADKEVNEPIKIIINYQKASSLNLTTVEFPNKKPIKTDLSFNSNNYDGYDLEFGLSNKIRCNPQNSKLHRNFYFVEIAEKSHVSDFITRRDMECGIEDSLFYIQKIEKDSLILLRNVFRDNEKEVNEISTYCLYNFLKKNNKMKIELLCNYDNKEKNYTQNQVALKKLKTTMVGKGIVENRIKISNTPLNNIRIKPYWQLENSVLYRIIEL